MRSTAIHCVQNATFCKSSELEIEEKLESLIRIDMSQEKNVCFIRYTDIEEKPKMGDYIFNNY